MKSWTLLRVRRVAQMIGVASLALACSDEAKTSNAAGGLFNSRDPSTSVDGLNGEDAAVITIGDLALNGSRYLAIKRSALGDRWFLSAYMKQFHPGGAETLGANGFGMRVVSFELRNDQLFMLDSSDRFKASEVANPDLLVDAYAVVHSAAFDALSGSDEYVLVDPARSLNDFTVSANVFGDPYLESRSFPVPLRIGLSYADNFRTLPDGVAFDQLFTGDADLRGYPPEVIPYEGVLDVWGTLSASLRRYTEGEGYTPTPHPGAAYYIPSDSKFTPDSIGTPTSVPSRWNFHAGMQPVAVFITAGAKRAQADNPEADILGALKRGVESWNAVFGFVALEAVFVDDDDIRAEDTTLIVDYPSGGVDFAFGSSQANPNTGEIRSGNVFLPGHYFDFSGFEPDVDDGEASESKQPFRQQRLQYRWGSLSSNSEVCRFQRRPRRMAQTLADSKTGSALTSDERGVRFLQFVTAHEIGHMIGLRHNFKGSLVPPSSSLMDYVPDEVMDELIEPGEYDIAAVRYLYQLSDEAPSHPFCSNEDTAFDPTCITFDAGADPLVDWLAPRMLDALDSIFDGSEPASERLEFSWLNETLAFARDDEFSTFALPEQRVEALRIALGRSASPLSATDASSPVTRDAANAVADFVLRRLVLDPIESRGAMALDVTDPGVIQFLSEQAGAMLRNEDGARSFELRRTAVDVLRALQDASALSELTLSFEVVQDQRDSGEFGGEELLYATDLIDRILFATTRYFE